MGSHINEDGFFQSNKYPTCPPGKVPLSVKDVTAQSLLWEYAQRRRAIDAEFADDLETALKAAGYEPPEPAVKVEAQMQLLGDLSKKFHQVLGAIKVRQFIVNDDAKLASGQRGMPAKMRQSFMDELMDDDAMTNILADGFEACVRTLAAMGDPTCTIHECRGEDIEVP